MEATRPTAPFTDVAELTQYFRTKLYSRDHGERVASFLEFYGVASGAELMAIPAQTNSGARSTFGKAWFAIFPFVDAVEQSVDVDSVFVGDEGYTIMFWGRWNGRCNASFTLPDGEVVELAGKSFEGVRYAYKLTFSRETKKVILFEGLWDVADWGRMMGSPAFAIGSARCSLYPA